jgi:hypothetical protein
MKYKNMDLLRVYAAGWYGIAMDLPSITLGMAVYLFRTLLKDFRNNK